MILIDQMKPIHQSLRVNLLLSSCHLLDMLLVFLEDDSTLKSMGTLESDNYTLLLEIWKSKRLSLPLF